MTKMEKERLETVRNASIHLRLSEQEYMDIKTYAKEHNLTAAQTMVRGFYFLKNQNQPEDNK